MAIDEVLACDEHTMASRVTYHGTSVDSGGRVEVSLGYVTTYSDRQIVHVEIFEHDDVAGLLARYEELGGTVESGALRSTERWLQEFKRRWNIHDQESIIELFDEDFALSDRRKIALWGEVRGREAQAAIHASSRARFEVDEVIACDDHVIASRIAWRGEHRGGEHSTDVGAVSVIRDGLHISMDVYDPDDRAAMIARYAELGGGAQLLGDRPPERVVAQYLKRFAARDLDALLELNDPEFEMVDHRPIGWEQMLGASSPAEMQTLIWEGTADIRVEVDEVLACDERLIALTATFKGTATQDTGGGPFLYSVGQVAVVDNGRYVRVEWFAPGARDAIHARCRELGGRSGAALGDQPIERLLGRHVERFNAHDVEGMSALVTDDFATVDHRTLSIGTTRGREHYERALRSVFDGNDMHLEISEVLAVDAHAIAVRTLYRGDGFFGAGAFSRDSHEVFCSRAGLLCRLEHYDDRAGAIARHAELRDARPPHRDRPPERLFAEHVARFNRHDIDADLELIADDFRYVDRRAISLGSTQGREAHRETLRSIFGVAPDARTEMQEVIACDDRVLAVRVRYHGHSVDGSGEFELLTAYVVVVEDGLWTSVDQYDPDDRRAILARFAELAWTAGRLPDILRRSDEALSRHDRVALGKTYAPDIVWVDRRSIGGEDYVGREAVVALGAATWETMSGDIRGSTDELLASDGRVFARVQAYRGAAEDGGGEFELLIGQVIVIDAGLISRIEFFDPGDRDAMLARFAELSQPEPVRIMREYARCYSANDLDGALAITAEDWVSVDHRALRMWEDLRGPDGIRQLWKSNGPYQADARCELGPVLACDDRVMAYTITFAGRGQHGVEYEFQFGGVSVVENGKWVRVDMYDPDNVPAMLARYAELAEARAPEAGPVKPWERFDLLYNERRFDELHRLYTEDYKMVDRRALAWEEIEGGAALVATCRGFIELAPDLVSRIDVLAEAPGFCLLRNTFIGHGFGTEGTEAGAVELVFDEVGIVTESQFVYTELFDPADEAAARTRYDELVAGGSAEAGPQRMSDRVWRRYLKAYNDHDVLGAGECLADDWTLSDHHATGMWDEVQGREAWTRQLQRVWSTRDGHDMRLELSETLAQDGRVGAWIVRFSGTDRRGGRYEVLMGWVMTFADERISSLDMYEPDDRAAILVRFAELGGGQALLGGRPSERWWSDVLVEYARGDVDALVSRYSEDWTYTDHRQLGWEQMTGHTDLREFWQSAIAASGARYGEIEEVLAADDRVAAVRVTWHGFDAEHGGEFAIAIGNISVVEAGLNICQEQYDPDDRQQMLARFEALAARPVHEAERVVRCSVEAYDRHDREGVAATYADDIVLIDHRVVAWEPCEGPAAVVEVAASGWEQMASGTRCRVDDVLARDDEVIALRIAYYGAADADDGGGEFELPIGFVTVVRDGLIARIELFDPSRRQEMIARYADLGGGLGRLGDTASERLFADYAKRYAARDVDGLLALVSDDWVLDDHRIVGWEPVPKDQYAAQMRAIWDSVAVIWIELDEVLAADDRVIAAIYTYRGNAAAEAGGGPFDYVVGFVGVNRGSQSVSGEFFDPDDRESILARYAELGGGRRAVLGELAPESWAREFSRLVPTRDIEGLVALFAENHVLQDHRTLGWGEESNGIAGVRAVVESFYGASPDIEVRFEMIACDDRAFAAREIISGHSADGGSPYEIALGLVGVVEGGRLAESHHFEDGDRDGMVACYAELGGR